jgi:HEAT repeat protein
MKLAVRACAVFLAAGLLALPLVARPLVLHPTTRGATTFAIIVDSVTYARTAGAVQGYRAAVEADGLPSYIVAGTWKSPAEVRAEIVALRKLQPPLEGVVFVGDIPIPMIRDAQHMTTAFKLDQERPWAESSVPSDRYYDDLDLQFVSIRQDSARPLLWYYSLAPASPQRIERDLYSGRIFPGVTGDAKYDVIAAYLRRVARQKGEKETLDHLLTFTGHGYHSEALSAWEGTLLTLREQFPRLYQPGGGVVKNLYHTMSPSMKAILLMEMQDPALDVALFHAHGADDTQYLVGDAPATTLDQHVAAIQEFLRSKLRTAKRRKQNLDEAKAYYAKAHNIPDAWFAGAFTDSVIAADSIAAERADLYVKDIEKIPTMARFVMFDECFNGNFTASPYIAGAYVFGNGKTVAAVGNAVNTLQDVWADEFLGLLNDGVRVGAWHRMHNSLESHIIGDPTYRFAGTGGPDLNLLLATKRNDVKTWERMLGDPNPVHRALAAEMLHGALGEKAFPRLSALFLSDPAFVVRVQALKGIAESGGPGFEKTLVQAIDDPFEYIRRLTVKWMGEIGAPAGVPALIRLIVTDPSVRVSFNGAGSLEMIGPEAVLPALHAFLATLPPEAEGEKQGAVIERGVRSKDEWARKELFPLAVSDTAKLRKRINALRSFRAYNFKAAVPLLAGIARNSRENEEVRVTALEAMGWYTMAYNRQELIAACGEVEVQPGVPARVRDEAIKTRNRLLTGPNNPLSP